MSRWSCILTCLVLLNSQIGPTCAADLLSLRQGDRVVLLGSTLIEREQGTAYWESALIAAHPEVQFTVRNLGWSGDTVWADSRAGFGTPDDGFRELQQQLATLRPTVMLVCYGANESYAGEPGLDHFRAGLNRLIDMLGTSTPRIALASPMRQQHLGGKLPNPEVNNRNLQLYSAAIREIAVQRGLPFVDFFSTILPAESVNVRSEQERLTENGVHLHDDGYRRTSGAFLAALGVGLRKTPVTIEIKSHTTTGAILCRDWQAKPDEIQWTMQRQFLIPADGIHLAIKGLSPGYWRMVIDENPVARLTAQKWEGGAPLPGGIDADQLEAIRQRVIAKNELYFHRWRPQNVTYLLGFRKHEQGNNAKEIAEFEPLVSQQEQQIHQLVVPAPHKVKLIRDAAGE